MKYELYAFNCLDEQLNEKIGLDMSDVEILLFFDQTQADTTQRRRV